jgi:hypothetical protein
MGSKGSTTRLAVLVGLVLLALALLVVPLANAAPATGPVFVGINTLGTFYGGAKAMPAQVNILDVTDATTYAGPLTTSALGTFVMVADLPLPTYATGFHATATAANFANAEQTFTVAYDTSGDFGFANVPPLYLPVNNTTISGTVKSLKTKKAVKGVKVTIGNKTVKTSRKGRFSVVIALWPATKYKATFAWKGHKKVAKSFTSAPGLSIAPFATVALR